MSVSSLNLGLWFLDWLLQSFNDFVRMGLVRSGRIVNIQASPVTWKSWDSLVLKSEGPVVLVEFYASWCGPCQMVHRVIDEIAAEYRDKVQCLMLNADDNVDVTEKYDIKAVPVVLIFKEGKKQDSIIGTMPKEFYVAAIDKALAS